MKFSPLLGGNSVFSMDLRHLSISIRVNTSGQSRVSFHFKVGSNCGRLSTFCTQIVIYNLHEYIKMAAGQHVYQTLC